MPLPLKSGETAYQTQAMMNMSFLELNGSGGDIFMNGVVIHGLTSGEVLVPVLVAADGTLQTSGAGGGGGGVVQQGTRDAGTALTDAWYQQLVTAAGAAYDARDRNWTITEIIPVSQSGAWTVAATQSGAWTVAATQSGAWTVAVSNQLTEYTEGDTDATITGIAAMWEDAADTLRPASASTPFPVDVKATVAQLAITNAIDTAAFDLQAAAFDSTTAVAADFILDNIEFNFSTTESKTITVSTTSGTVLYQDTNTAQSVELGDINQGFDSGDEVRVQITQFSSPGTCDVVVKVRQGSSSLAGNPAVTIVPVNDTYVISEDASFVVGDSPASFDVNAALGRNGTQFTLWNDGAGSLTVAVSNDGATFSGEHTVLGGGETFGLVDVEIDTIRVTHVANTAYRIVAL